MDNPANEANGFEIEKIPAIAFSEIGDGFGNTLWVERPGMRITLKRNNGEELYFDFTMDAFHAICFYATGLAVDA